MIGTSSHWGLQGKVSSTRVKDGCITLLINDLEALAKRNDIAAGIVRLVQGKVTILKSINEIPVKNNDPCSSLQVGVRNEGAVQTDMHIVTVKGVIEDINEKLQDEKCKGWIGHEELGTIMKERGNPILKWIEQLPEKVMPRKGPCTIL